MYLAFFGLTGKPFAITPDPRYLYLSARHADALAHLVYGINDAGGFIQLTGEVGTGKTTTIRSLLAQAPKNAEIALVLNPSLSPAEFLQTVCEELGLGAPDAADGNIKALTDLLNRYLLRAHAEGRRVVLIVDEAQNLGVEMLEHVRLLTNLETETQKLLQIILIGQPELRELLARPQLRQLAQRITGRYHLDPLSRAETAAYVLHRLRVAGATSDIFTPAALREVHRISGGIPRLINVLCDRALLAAYTEERHQIPAALVRRAGSEAFGYRIVPAWTAPLIAGMAVVVIAASGLAFWRHAPQYFRVRSVAAAKPLSGAGTAAGPAAKAGADPARPIVRPVSSGAATAPDASSVVPLATLLRRDGAAMSMDSAFTQLFALWQADYKADGTDACTQAQAQGLLCMMQHGSLAQLQELNRPAILILNDGGNSDYQVVLTALRDERVQIRAGALSAWVSVSDLEQDWFGDFVLLWRPGTKNVRELAAGMRGAAVERLRRSLERWSGQAAAATVSGQYDDGLVQLVKLFQRQHRLTADGVAGIDTQVALDAALASAGTPVLRPAGSGS